MPKPPTRTLLLRLPDPRSIGNAEYTTLHEYVTDLIDSGNGLPEIAASMREMALWCDIVIRHTEDITEDANP